MGRPGAVDPPAAPAGERACLNCDEPFTPAREGWQALYCTLACWRADNGGPRRRAGSRPHSAVTSVDPFMPRAEVEQREAFVQEVATALAPARLAVTGVAWCPACDAPHEVYGYRGAR